MPIAKLQDNSCSVARSLSILGERWTLLILRVALEGETRFEALGMAPDVLSDRLNTLVEYGVMTREPGRRTRYEYQLTPAGRELQIVVGGLQQWGDARLPRPEGPTVLRQARKTARPVRVAFVDDRGREGPARPGRNVAHGRLPDESVHGLTHGGRLRRRRGRPAPGPGGRGRALRPVRLRPP